VNLLEKLLVPALAKLSNLVAGAGIWMNTQRPEWNDANNALARGGVSVVTLCHLRRYLTRFEQILAGAEAGTLPVSTEVAGWCARVATALAAAQERHAREGVTPQNRQRLLDAVGAAYSDYREAVYDAGFSGTTRVPLGEIVALCRTARMLVDEGIAANRRADGLYHTYHQLEFAADGSGATVIPLPEMLEGQVAALSSGLLDADASLDVLEALYASDLYRPDQKSFTLQPYRELPGFLDRNRVPDAAAGAIPLVNDLLAAGDRSLLARDAAGVLRFQGDLRSADDLAGVLDRLGARTELADAVARDRAAVMELWEDVFAHRSYTGRSGVMYAYEGLGCIYWHMVAKLLLAVQETLARADAEGCPPATRAALARMYVRIRSGLGYEKTVAEYGAFPTDPYSHTPLDGGAKQPGMTGQVKEEILTRLGELGVVVDRGDVAFRPLLLRQDDFLARPDTFRFVDLQGGDRSLALPAGCLAFTFCGVPVVYELTDDDVWLRATLADGSTVAGVDGRLGHELSRELLRRGGRIEHVRLGWPRQRIGW
jgi:hypothetical protein